MEILKEMTMSDVQAIIFDVGGVLSPNIIFTKLTDLAEKYDKDSEILIRIGQQYRVKADLGEISDGEYWQQVLLEVGVKATAEDLAIDSYLTLTEPSLELACRLKSNYRVAILSNDSREMATTRRRKFGFDEIFDPVLISCDLGAVKPQPQIYDIAAEKLQLKPQQCIFVDDMEENVVAADERGMRGIQFHDAVHLHTTLLQMGLKC